MIIDDLLFAIIIAGLGLSGAHLRSELLLHRQLTAQQRRRELLQQQCLAKRMGLRQNVMPSARVHGQKLAMAFKPLACPVGLLAALSAAAALTVHELRRDR